MNYMKFTVVMAAVIALTQYLEDQKIIPNEGIVCSMALVAILAGGAVINAFAFVGRNYLVLFLSGYDPEASLEEKKTWQSFWGLLSRLRQIRKRKKETPWLDWNAARNQRADQAELYEHRLGLQTVQPGSPTGATHHSQWTHVLWVLPTQCSAKIRFDNFCRHRCCCAWIRRFSFFYIISFNQNSSSIRLSHCICFSLKKMSISFITPCISGRSMSKRLSITFKRGQEAKCSKTNYSPQGYWHQKARRRGKVSDDAAKKQLIKQVIWQINLVAAKHIPLPKFDVSTPNTVH